MLRSASREDHITSGVDSWEHFCREEARQAACSFLERVKRFKTRNAAARDVHDSTFTNEFSAAFLEESSVLMASGDTQLGCAINGQSQSHGFAINRTTSTRSGRGTFMREESKSSSSSGGKKAWWSNIFKWPKSKRDRRNNSGSGGLSSSGEYLSPSRSNSTAQQRRRVILDGQLRLLDLTETEGPLLWTPCKLVLAEAQGHYQVEIFMPPKSAVAKTTLFCFLIEDVRSTTALEIPDSTTCFVIKSQNHGEHVFNADTELKKRRWIQALLDCKSQIIRSASAQTHLATLPRTPQRTPVRLPNGTASCTNGVVSLETSPIVNSHGRSPRYTSYASSDSSDQKKSTLNVGAESDGEDSMMDVTSLIRRLNHASPSRRRKVQSMFVDSSNLHSVHPTTATATMMACSHYQPPPLLSYSPPDYEQDYLHHQPPSLPARLPFSSLPTDCSTAAAASSPPPLPKRNPPPRSSCSASASSSTNQKLPPRGIEHHHHSHHRTSPNHMPHPVSSATTSTSTSVTTHPPLPPMSTARLAAISTANDVTSTVSSSACNTNSACSSSARVQASPRRKFSQPFVDIPPTIHSGSSQGNLELCSQSSSSSALHPVSLAAVQRSMAATNGRRRSSITSNPGDSTQPMSLFNLQAFQKPNDRVRKMSAPVLIPGDQGKRIGLGDESSSTALLQKKIGNGVPGQKNVYNSSDILNDIPKETSPVPESDREQEEEEEEERARDGEGEREREKEEREREKEREKIDPGVGEQASSTSVTGGQAAAGGSHGDGSSGVAESALSLVQKRHQEERGGITEKGINCDENETTSRKATFTFPYNSSQASQASQASNSGSSPPVPPRISSPLLIQQRSEVRGRSGSPLTPDLVTSHLSYHQPSRQLENDNEGGLMTGTLVAGTGMGPGPLSLGAAGGRVGVGMGGVSSERRGHQRGHSLISSHSIQTNPSTRTNSSSSDGAESNHTSGPPGITNPIYVETNEGERGRVSSHHHRVESHTQHPYEHWATNQQDVANLRLLSRYPWFHGMVSRANASQLVLTEGESGTGQYLVRQSESREGDFVLTFNYHNRAKHLRMAVDEGGCNIQHLWFDDVPSMLEYFKTNSIPLESFWLNDDVKLTTYIDRQASDSFRTTTVVDMDRLSRVPPRRSRSLHLNMANSVNAAASSNNSSNPDTPLPLPLDTNASSASSPNSQSTNSLPQSARNSTGWRLFRSQRSSSAGNVGRVQRRHSANVGSLLSTGPNSNRSSGRRRRNNNNGENAYVVRNY